MGRLRGTEYLPCHTHPSATMNSSAIPLDRDVDDLEGQVVGRYRVERLIRRGGMGDVFLGHHVGTGAKVAIKVQHAAAIEDENLGARFDREAELMGRLSGCSGVIGVHDVGVLPSERRYVVMDFIRGLDLSDLLNEAAGADELLSVVRVCEIMADVAAAVHAAHERGVIHRDLKPANIMLEAMPGGRERALILDFGVSADRGDRGRVQALTSTGEVLGTPQYMAPEQAAGVPVTPAVDLYAMGSVMHQMLSGHAPARRGWSVPKVPLDDLREAHPSLVALLDDLLQPDPHLRPDSAAIVEAELRNVLRALQGGIRIDAAQRASFAVAGSMIAPDRADPEPEQLPVCSAPARRSYSMHPALLGVLFGIVVAICAALSTSNTLQGLTTSFMRFDSATHDTAAARSSSTPE